PESQSNHRYVGGQRLYLAECSPWKSATWIFDNEDLELPTLRRLSEESAGNPRTENTVAED
ncbi:MAG: uridine kinase, partial [Brevibacterium aurantiacum]|nr:uridine kinase [Brevibacterium aurantiacum]